VWQALYDELADDGFMVVAVAEDSRGAERARPWIEQSKSTYWSLIDVDHRVSDLYGMVNVPQAVWIDEAGRIVRPTEVAGSTDHFRGVDRSTFRYDPEKFAQRKASHDAYMDAVREWVRSGAHAYDAPTAAARQPRITTDVARAQALTRLAVWLAGAGRNDEAQRHFAEASRLHPESWTVWRQAADLDGNGKAVGPEFWARVDALGARKYYVPPDVPGYRPA